MIDLHCHILPEIDDGPATMDESLEMARLMLEDGIHTVVASAHITRGIYDNTPEKIRGAAARFARRLREEGIPLRVLPGADVRLGPELLEGDGGYLRINETTPYLLLEFPHDLIPPGSGRLVAALRARGRVPIITHPERNLEIQRRPERLDPFLEMGCLVQVTAMSLTGSFGPAARTLTERWMTEGRVHVIATDAHDAIRRPPRLSIAARRAAELVGDPAARAMVFDTPERIVNGMPVPTLPPVSAPAGIDAGPSSAPDSE